MVWAIDLDPDAIDMLGESLGRTKKKVMNPEDVPRIDYDLGSWEHSEL